MKLILILSLLAGFTYAQNKPKNIDELFEQMRKEQRGMHQKLLNQFFNDDFFKRDRDPFKELRKMRKMMEKKLSGSQKGFDGWYQDRMGGGDVSDISKVEDEKSVTFKIRIDNIKDKKVDVALEDGMISIKGHTEIETKNEGQKQKSHSVTSSTFSRSFPIPKNVDEKKADIKIDGDVILVKFPKRNGSKKTIAIDKELVI